MKKRYDHIYNFLIEEYKSTDISRIEIEKGIELDMRFFYQFNAGLVILLGAILKLFNPSLENILKINQISSFLGILISVLGIILSFLFLEKLYKARLKEVWIFTKLNYIRRIFLEPYIENDKNLKYYINTFQGSIEPYVKSKEKIKTHQWYFYSKIVSFILSLWSCLVVNFIYLFFNLNINLTYIFILSIIFIISIYSLMIKFYLEKLIKNIEMKMKENLEIFTNLIKGDD